MPTIEELIRSGAAALPGSSSARLDAELLLGMVLDQPRSRLLARMEDRPSETVRRRYDGLLRRRASGIPLAYLIGYQEFYGRRFTVTPEVLVPRPESELLVEFALAAVRQGDTVVDIGTGSGCLGLSIAAERPDLPVHLVDASAAALEVAKGNARDLGVTVSLHQADLWPADLNPDPLQTIVVANLPYVSDDAYAANPNLRHEPAEALRGGTDGLDLIRRLLGRLQPRPPRLILLEINPAQAETAFGPAWSAQLHYDLAGRARVLALTPAALPAVP